MNKRTDIPLGKDVYCTDRLAGQSSHLIPNPLNRRATPLVVRKRRPIQHSVALRTTLFQLVLNSTQAFVRGAISGTKILSWVPNLTTTLPSPASTTSPTPNLACRTLSPAR